MYKLLPSAFNVGIDSETCLLLSSLQNTGQITPPITVAKIRDQLETGQVSTFSDAGFNQFLNRIYSLPLDYSALTAAEITVLNVIFEYLDPPPAYDCCGNGATYPTVIGDIDYSFTSRVGSGFEYAVDVVLNGLFSCQIFDVVVSLVKVNPASPDPAPASMPLNKLGCVNGKQAFKFLWMNFLADPTGHTYNLEFTFRDSTGATLSLLSDSITF